MSELKAVVSFHGYPRIIFERVIYLSYTFQAVQSLLVFVAKQAYYVFFLKLSVVTVKD